MIRRSTPGMTGNAPQLLTGERGPGRRQGSSRVGNPGCRGQHGLQPFADDELRSGRPQLDHTGTAEHAPIDLLDLAVPVFERDALNADRLDR